MLQRRKKLACFCITTALFAVTAAMSVEAGEMKFKQDRKIAIAQVSSHLNVRSQPSTEGEILGKLHNNSVGEVIGREGEWLKIKSGSVEGYIKKEYALTGKKAKKKAKKVGMRKAKVKATTLRIRKEATTDSETIGLLPKAEVIAVEDVADGWVKVNSAEGKGYVSKKHVKMYRVNTVAESKEEEAARLAKEEAKKNNGKKPSAGSNSSSTSDLGTRIANYALQFVGNPYVWGGTSLTNGADCSGFVMSVYKHFGIHLPRTSSEQGKCGTNIGTSTSKARPGDLVHYPGHIGIYIGNGKIVHASTAKTGIKVSKATYRSISSIRRIVK